MGSGQIAVIGNYLPRKCGIATFTTDLCETLASLTDDAGCFALAVSDTKAGYDYPERVRFEIKQDDLSSYGRAGDFLNLSDVDVICLQHEYGIFGGVAGSYILRLLREARSPVVTTLHTVLREPDIQQRQVLEEIAQLSDRLVVMSERAVSYLRTLYHVPAEKIDLIPHGIPDVPFVDPNFYKDKFGVEGKTVLLTFGLLSPNKGIEYVIRALPQIVADHPDVVYLVLGATHPQVRREQGESYRQSLAQLVREQHVSEHVVFIDQFVSLENLVEYIGAADIYVTPYLNPQQIVSGTLAYAVGAGKAVVSTPYWYAEELLTGERGRLANFGDSHSLAEQISYLLEHDVERHAMRKRAYLHARGMIWPEVGQRYRASFERAREERRHRPRLFSTPRLSSGDETLPALNLQHLWRMTDDTGLFQHAIYSMPNYTEGYTTDDNTRALSLAVLLEEAGEDFLGDVGPLTTRYMAFLWQAFNPANNRFRNFMSFDRRWLEEVGSDDSHGRALQTLGLVLGRSAQKDLRGVALRLFERALPATLELDSPRAWAFSILGVCEYLRRFGGDRAARQVLTTLAERLWSSYRAHQSPDWPWLEPQLTYCNAVLPHALLVAGHHLERSELTSAALQSLQWLINQQRNKSGDFTPIGCNGFYPQGGAKARFDQQPVETQCLVAACLEVWQLTHDVHWCSEAVWVFGWFLGRNDLGLSLYDPQTGGCHDGLQPDRLNNNQGAESTLAFLTSLLEIRQAKRMLLPEAAVTTNGNGAHRPLQASFPSLKTL